MRSATITLILLGFLAGLVPASQAADTREVTVLVASDPTDLSALSSLAGVSISERDVFGWRRLTVTTAEDVTELIDRLQSELGLTVMPDYELQMFGPESEPSFPTQWHLENTGQSGGTPGADVGAKEAWEMSTGDPTIVVAVVDSGVEVTHPDLAAGIFVNPGEIPANGIDDDGNGLIDDVTGWDFVGDDPDPTSPTALDNGPHGTLVSGVIAARSNGVGIAGMAPGVALLPIRSCNAISCSSSVVAEGVEYAVDLGADIINLSLGGYIPADAVSGDPLAAAIDYAESHGVLVVAAAGNDGWNVDALTDTLVQSEYPGYPSGTQPLLSPAGLSNTNILSVAATDDDDALAGFSNYGIVSVDVAAPGTDITSTDMGDGYDAVSGTSFAAPLTSGVAALMLSINPDLTPSQIVDLIRTYSETRPSLSGVVASGSRLDASDPVFAGKLRDIQDSVFRDDIVWMAAEGITKGCNPPFNDLFCPDSSVTRGQMAAFLHRALGGMLTEGTPLDFVDTATSEFEADIAWLSAVGITKGCNPPDNDRFCPDFKVTREQMAAFLVRALGYTDPGSKDFVDDDDSAFESEIEKLATAGVTKGCNPPDNDRFCPTSKVTRGQMAAFLHRALGT